MTDKPGPAIQHQRDVIGDYVSVMNADDHRQGEFRDKVRNDIAVGFLKMWRQIDQASPPRKLSNDGHIRTMGPIILSFF